MKKITQLVAILAFAVWGASANAAIILIEIDIADLSAVTFSATGAAPSVAGSGSDTIQGVSLRQFFANDEIVGSAVGSVNGNLKANGTTSLYNDSLVFPGGFDLNIYSDNPNIEPQYFITTAPAFSGVSTVNLTGFSVPKEGASGDILDSDDTIAGEIIGQWLVVNSTPSVPVPVPATIALFIVGLAGLGWSRRKR